MPEVQQTSHLPADFNLKEQLKRDLEQAAAGASGIVREKVRMSPKGFTIPDGTPENIFTCVIVDSINANTHYPETFDLKNPTPPNCFAIGRIQDQMQPDSSVDKPYSKDCRDCPKNEYESGVGRAKACKNTKVLAVMAEGANKDDSPIWIMIIPPKAIRYFDSYVATVLRGSHGLPPIGVLTEMTMDAKVTYAAPRFKFKRELKDSELEYFYGRKSEAEAILLQKPVMITG